MMKIVKTNVYLLWIFLSSFYIFSCESIYIDECCKYETRVKAHSNSDCFKSVYNGFRLGMHIDEVLKLSENNLEDGTYGPDQTDSLCSNDRIYDSSYFIGSNQLIEVTETFVFCERKLIKYRITFSLNKSVPFSFFQEEFISPTTSELLPVLNWILPGEIIERRTDCEKATFSLTDFTFNNIRSSWRFLVVYEALPPVYHLF